MCVNYKVPINMNLDPFKVSYSSDNTSSGKFLNVVSQSPTPDLNSKVLSQGLRIYIKNSSLVDLILVIQLYFKFCFNQSS